MTTGRAVTLVACRERTSSELADLEMLGSLAVLDEVLRRVDGGSLMGSEAIERLLEAQITLQGNRRLEAAIRWSRLPGRRGGGLPSGPRCAGSRSIRSTSRS